MNVWFSGFNATVNNKLDIIVIWISELKYYKPF